MDSRERLDAFWGYLAMAPKDEKAEKTVRSFVRQSADAAPLTLILAMAKLIGDAQEAYLKDRN